MGWDGTARALLSVVEGKKRQGSLSFCTLMRPRNTAGEAGVQRDSILQRTLVVWDGNQGAGAPRHRDAVGMRRFVMASSTARSADSLPRRLDAGRLPSAAMAKGMRRCAWA